MKKIFILLVFLSFVDPADILAQDQIPTVMVPILQCENLTEVESGRVLFPKVIFSVSLPALFSPGDNQHPGVGLFYQEDPATGELSDRSTLTVTGYEFSLSEENMTVSGGFILPRDGWKLIRFVFDLDPISELQTVAFTGEGEDGETVELEIICQILLIDSR